MLHVTITFNLIRGTNLAEFFSCAMFGDGQCVVVHPFSAVVVDPVAICICHVALHLVFHYCSDLPSDVSIEFSRIC